MAADGARKADADETMSMRMAAQLLSDQRAWIHALLRRGRTGTREDAGDGGREAEGGCHHAALETWALLGDGQRGLLVGDVPKRRAGVRAARVRV